MLDVGACLGAAPRAVAEVKRTSRATALVRSIKIPDLIQGTVQTQPQHGRSTLGLLSGSFIYLADHLIKERTPLFMLHSSKYMPRARRVPRACLALGVEV